MDDSSKVYVEQSVSNRFSLVAIFVIEGIFVVLSFNNIALSVFNFASGTPLQKKFNIALMVLAIFSLSAPVTGIVLAYATFADDVAYRNEWLTLLLENQVPVPDRVWWARIQWIKMIHNDTMFFSVTFLVLVFYVNFRTIRYIRPFSIAWDYLIYGGNVAAVVCLIVLIPFENMQQAYMIVMLIMSIIDAIVFHFFAIHFVRTLIYHCKKLRASNLQRLAQGSNDDAINRLSESEFRDKVQIKKVFRLVLYSAIVFWTSAVLIVTGGLLTRLYPDHANLGSLLLKASFLFLPMGVAYTIAFVTGVRDFLRWISTPPPTLVSTYLDVNNTENFVSLRQIQNNRSIFQRVVSRGYLAKKDYQTLNTASTTSTNASTVGKPYNYSSSSTHRDETLIGRSPTLDHGLKRFPIEPDDLGDNASWMPLIALSKSESEVVSEFQQHEPRIFTVTHPFNDSSRGDEISLAVGDKVRVDVVFEDEWAMGVNQTTNTCGYFPLHCFSRMPNLSPRDEMYDVEKNNSQSYVMVPFDHTNKQVLPRKSSNASSVLQTRSNQMFPSLSVGEYTELLVIHPYTPARSDELELIPGSRVRVVTVYDDGWAYGITIDTSGIFPLGCCLLNKQKD